MTPEIIQSYAQLGVAGLAVSALVYVFVFYIRHTTKQHDDHLQVIEGVKGALEKIVEGTDKNTEATKANTIITSKTAETMDEMKTVLVVHNELVRGLAGGAGGGKDGDDKELPIT